MRDISQRLFEWKRPSSSLGSCPENLYPEHVVFVLCQELPYLPVYKSIPCISRPPILEPKNKFFSFLGENFLKKVILYLRTFFQARYSYTKKITASLDVKFKFIIARTRVLKRVLATQV